VISPLTRQKEIYSLKANYMNDQQLNLQERLVRYNAKALADEKTSFCSAKQELDMEVLRGKPPAEIQKLASPVKGQPVFFDPLNTQLDMVKRRRKEVEEENALKWKGEDFQRSIAEIPKVAYHPATLLTQMQLGQTSLKQISRLAKVKPALWTEEDFAVLSPDRVESSLGSASGAAGVSALASIHQQLQSPQFDRSGKVLPEASLQLAMLKSKSGDTRALYELFMHGQTAAASGEEGQGSISLARADGLLQFDNTLAAGSMDSLANSDFNYTSGPNMGISDSIIASKNLPALGYDIPTDTHRAASPSSDKQQQQQQQQQQQPLRQKHLSNGKLGHVRVRTPSEETEAAAHYSRAAQAAAGQSSQVHLSASSSGAALVDGSSKSEEKDKVKAKNSRNSPVSPTQSPTLSTDANVSAKANTSAKGSQGASNAPQVVAVASIGYADQGLLSEKVPDISASLDEVDPAIAAGFSALFVDTDTPSARGFAALSLDESVSPTGSIDNEETRSSTKRQIF
jgi:hypothetical protein